LLANCRDEPPKYHLVARQLIEKNHNTFHIKLTDVKKFNNNLAGFLSSNKLYHKIAEFIEDLNIGTLNNGLYYSIERGN
jgi:hypothetical protein